MKSRLIEDFLSKIQEISLREGARQHLFDGFRLKFSGTDEELARLQEKVRAEGLTLEDLDKFELTYEATLKNCAGSYGSQI